MLRTLPTKDPFTYQKPTPRQTQGMALIRQTLGAVRDMLTVEVPAGPDRDEAIRHLRMASMFANAGIVLAED